ncbi:MAG: AAA family ATPase [Alphaproteobacteria bacterium]|nr:AAA family ATPase [Alphaproteobacteria bacterium]MBQ6861731.1 AAA family ATPase [Alistipes sp.]
MRTIEEKLASLNATSVWYFAKQDTNFDNAFKAVHIVDELGQQWEDDGTTAWSTKAASKGLDSNHRILSVAQLLGLLTKNNPFGKSQYKSETPTPVYRAISRYAIGSPEYNALKTEQLLKLRMNAITDTRPESADYNIAPVLFTYEVFWRLKAKGVTEVSLGDFYTYVMTCKTHDEIDECVEHLLDPNRKETPYVANYKSDSRVVTLIQNNLNLIQFTATTVSIKPEFAHYFGYFFNGAYTSFVNMMKFVVTDVHMYQTVLTNPIGLSVNFLDTASLPLIETMRINLDTNGPKDNPLQKVYYGCPGSGKSHEVKRITNTSNTEGFSGLSSIERRQAYQKFLDNKHGHKKTYKGGGTNIDALTHPKLMEYISLCTEFEINSLFEISNEEDFNAIIEALKGCEAYQNDSITKGSGCHWETGLKSYGEFLKDQILNTEPRKDAVFRTTFHPDTDYAAFVGCYKPSMNDGVIEYSFTPQVFTNAYIAAWENTKKPVYLIIEEINRGNCAQIFGDLFQLLDRDKETGKSEYPIKADKDLVAHIEKVLGAGHEGIKNGELCLPSNLFIYATMNTSDQSLFPMDSAFKRRWDWEYVPINYSKDIDSGKFVIEIDDDTKYSWVEFLESVNDKIYDATNSEDKQMGNFFIKKSIKANEFVNKVMFYLWNEVCKEEYGTQRNFFRKGKEGKTEFKFTELFGDNKATILKEFMTSLGVEPIGKKTEEPAAE